MAPVAPTLFSRMLAASGAPSIAHERFSKHVDLRSDALANYRHHFKIPSCKAIGSRIEEIGNINRERERDE
jgi:hypothetical protein